MKKTPSFDSPVNIIVDMATTTTRFKEVTFGYYPPAHEIRQAAKDDRIKYGI